MKTAIIEACEWDPYTQSVSDKRTDRWFGDVAMTSTRLRLCLLKKGEFTCDRCIMQEACWQQTDSILRDCDVVFVVGKAAQQILMHRRGVYGTDRPRDVLWLSGKYAGIPHPMKDLRFSEIHDGLIAAFILSVLKERRT